MVLRVTRFALEGLHLCDLCGRGIARVTAVSRLVGEQEEREQACRQAGGDQGRNRDPDEALSEDAGDFQGARERTSARKDAQGCHDTYSESEEDAEGDRPLAV